MTQAEIKHVQARIGTTVDGFWGPKSTAACQAYLRRLMPSPNPWPKTDQASLTAFYGKPGDERQLTRLMLPPEVTIKYEGRRVDRITCHRKVHDSLLRVLVDAYQICPEVISVYDGCYNNRSMRGGSLPSLHARGAAIDFDAGRNGNKTHWPTAANMPLEVMECFAREGWLSAGASWSRDAMHFQATR